MMLNQKLDFTMTSKTVQDIVNLYNNEQLNLEPGFQRDSVWSLNDRKKLIDSILRNYPLPAIFLYRRDEKGEIKYDVIDGKQRLESIFMFSGVYRGGTFSIKSAVDGESEERLIDYKYLQKKNKQSKITGYNITVIEVDGNFSDIIDLFVRINSTGKALSGAEKRHARYYKSEFLKLSAKLAERYKDYLKKQKVISDSQISRMKHVELVCELLISIMHSDVINKKSALDKIMGAEKTTSASIQKGIKNLVLILNRLEKMFPNLKETRFSQLSDFYTLVVLIHKFETEKLILTDKKRNSIAWNFLKQFSIGVDRVRELQKKAKGSDDGDEIYRTYLLTVMQNTDEIQQRRNRENIVRNILEPLYRKKDNERIFSNEQRRIIWNSTSLNNRRCSVCSKKLTWEDFTIDHIIPYSKGGKTDLGNADLMCKKHNSSKGNREIIKIK